MNESEKLRALATAIDTRDSILRWMGEHGEREQTIEHFNWKWGASATGNHEVRRALIGVVEREWFALLEKALKRAEGDVAAGRAALKEG